MKMNYLESIWNLGLFGGNERFRHQLIVIFRGIAELWLEKYKQYEGEKSIFSPKILNPNRLLLIALFWMCSNALLANPSIQFSQSDWEFATAQETNWSKEQPTEMGQYRIRFTVTVTGEKSPLEHYGLYVSMLASSVVYWDGVLIGESGEVGTSKETEVPGALMTACLIPDSLLKAGPHQVEMLISNFHANDRIRLYGAWVFDYESTLIAPIVLAAYMHIYAGCFLIIGLFFGVRFITNRKDYPLLAFSLLCLSFFSLVILEYLRSYHFYLYPWHFTRLQIILGLTILIGLCLPVFFALRFELKGYLKYIIGLLLVYAALIFVTYYGYDVATYLSMVVGFVVASLFCIKAIRLKRSGSWLALVGVLPVALALIIWYNYYDLVLYVGFGHLVLMILISLAIKEKETTRLKEEALLLSSRLEVELLKKNIQPHFLMNSITSAIDWIERHPPEGVKLLLALSREFELLLDISGKKQIPIEQEVALCRAHLEIMGFRKEQAYDFTTTGIDETDLIPPAIFLTVVENGISHQQAGAPPVHFYLTKIQNEKGVVYRVLAEGAGGAGKKVVEYGTGLKYIEARLEESYPGKWSLTSESAEAGWVTEMLIEVN